MEYVLTADKYADALRNGTFMGLKCRTCGAYTVPPRKVCSACQGEDVEAAELSRRGEVRSFTVIHMAAEGFAAPYMVGLVETEEGPWVTVSIIDFDPERATMENLIGRKGRIDYREVPADLFSGGARISLTFKVAD
jgi:hypothetical protein